MNSEFFKTHKATLFKIITVVLLIVIVAHYINAYKRKLYKKLNTIEKKLDYLQARTLENNFVQTGYLINNFANYEKDLKSSIFLSGIFTPNLGISILKTIGLGTLNVLSGT